MMHGIELQSRREALSLSQDDLARLLNVNRLTISRWETGARAIPEGIDAELARLEDRALGLTDRMIELVANAPDVSVLMVHEDQATADAAHPEMDGSPPVVQRVAAARALVELRAEGIGVNILPAVVPSDSDGV
jgi:transcriptional regulator with XRE-family HTH domain